MKLLLITVFNVLTLCLISASFAVTVQHSGASDPSVGDWDIVAGDSPVGGSPISPDTDFPTTNAWQIDAGASLRHRYEVAPGPMSNEDWFYSASLRVVSGPSTPNANTLLEVSDESNRYLLTFGVDGNGALVVEAVNSGLPIATISSSSNPLSEYVDLFMLHDSITGTVDVFANNALIFADYAGFSGALMRINFGDGQSSGSAVSRFSTVLFSTDDSDGDGLIDAVETNTGIFTHAADTGTDPNNNDTDGDGLLDGVETNTGIFIDASDTGTHPLALDTDADFVSDNNEIQLTQTDPTLPQMFADFLLTQRDGADSLLQGNLSDGVRTIVSQSGTGVGTVFNNPVGVVVEANGNILVVNVSGSSLMRVNPATGDRTVISGSSAPGTVQIGSGTNLSQPTGIVIESGLSAIVADQGSTDRLFRVDLATGDRTVMHSYSDSAGPLYIAREINGDILVSHQTTKDIRRYREITPGILTEQDVLPILWSDNITPVDTLGGVAVQLDGRMVVSVSVGSVHAVQLREANGSFITQTIVPAITQARAVAAPLNNIALITNWDNTGTLDSVGEVNFNNDAHTVISAGGADIPFPEGLVLRALRDGDSDGLGDIDELARGFDPANNDTDNDGLLDGFEFQYGFNPLVVGEALLDGDADGLNSLAEQAAGTDPNDADSDDDGFNDGIEVDVGTNPNIGTQTPLAHKLLASDGAASDVLGASVDISGDTAVVGAYFDDDSGNASGSAYVYIRNGQVWSEQQKLVASDAAADDRFGFSVSVSGDTVVVGSHLNDDDGDRSGSAYVFTRTGQTWSEQQKLTASDAAPLDLFGRSVSISGDSVIIGAYQDDDDGVRSGSAYVFTRNGSVWGEQQKLTASDASHSDLFGWSVALSGDTGIVGAFGTAGQGSAYVFIRQNGVWSEQQKLIASDGVGDNSFGQSVAIAADTAIVGAASIEAAYVYARNATTWTEQKIQANNVVSGDRFGETVSVSGDKVVVGLGSGTRNVAYVFDRNGASWTQLQELVPVPDDSTITQGFPSSVSVEADTVIAGVTGDQEVAPFAGAAFVFDLDADNDGLENIAEQSNGTDQLDADTDDDGLLDGFEVTYGFDPISVNESLLDGDGDNLTNIEEQNVGTDPTDSDTDNDAFSDGVEVVAGSDPLDPESIPSVQIPIVPAFTWLLFCCLILLNGLTRRSKTG